MQYVLFVFDFFHVAYALPEAYPCCDMYFILLWLNTIPLYRYIKSSLSSRHLRWTFVWFSTFWNKFMGLFLDSEFCFLIYMSVYKPLPHSSLFFLRTVITIMILDSYWNLQGYKLLCCQLFTDLTWDSIIMLMIR